MKSGVFWEVTHYHSGMLACLSKRCQSWKLPQKYLTAKMRDNSLRQIFFQSELLDYFLKTVDYVEEEIML